MSSALNFCVTLAEGVSGGLAHEHRVDDTLSTRSEFVHYFIYF